MDPRVARRRAHRQPDRRPRRRRRQRKARPRPHARDPVELPTLRAGSFEPDLTRIPMFLPNFEHTRIPVDGVTINVVHAGVGPPVLLLHGYPQTHVMWHRVAPVLAERYTVVCPDLRGCGDSDVPESDREHMSYSKRAMARDQVGVMQALGFERFSVVGHDRGARVAHRMALDHPERVAGLVLLDIVPTKTVFDTVNRVVATGYYHWFMMLQPELPERLIGGAAEFYVRWSLERWGASSGALTDEAVAEYVRCF